MQWHRGTVAIVTLFLLLADACSWSNVAPPTAHPLHPDASSPAVSDAGQSTDASTIDLDASEPLIDAGEPGDDAGEPVLDASEPGDDAGEPDDASVTPPGDAGSSACTPDCYGRECGDDGCGGSCGSCDTGDTCDIAGQCSTPCAPDCTGKSCGPNGCGGSCGTCADSQTCDDSGQCVSMCTPACSGRSCGANECGGSCGACSSDQTCDGSGQCVADCMPSCGGRACGDDGCGGSCGACGANEQCQDSQCVSSCQPQCTGRACGDDGCGGSCGTCDPVATCHSGSGECLCATPEEVIIYTQSAWNPLADALAADPSPCAQHWISIPAAADSSGLKTMPRSGEADAMHGRGPQFHALAEFHWASWSKVTSMSWYDKGVEFRRRMAAADYDVQVGDTWAINELPSAVRHDATVRANVLEALRGLYTGPSGAAPSRGAVFISGIGQNATYLTTYKANVENWLTDASFWVSANNHARWWAQEVYADPMYSCEPNTTVAARAQVLNDFVEHFARLAAAGPNAANTAQSYLSRAYVPLMNAVWNSNNTGYGNTTIPLNEMENHVSDQVYAVRSWAGQHNYPDGRIGFAWARTTGTSDTDLIVLATRLAASIHDAYDTGGTPAHACSSSGAYTWCQCSVSGASVNNAWQTFSTW